MEKKFRYFMAIPLSDLDSKHPGYHLKKVRRLLNVKQCKVAENTDHCDSTISDLERRRKNPKFYTIQLYLKALGVEFYAFALPESPRLCNCIAVVKSFQSLHDIAHR